MGHNLARMNDIDRYVFSKESRYCFFLSHKKEDEVAALAIGEYLTDIVGLNIYLDTEDCILREAVSVENDQKIVESIQAGLSCSTHLLCLVSDRTKLSWWVPYEIGYAEKQGLEIASLKLAYVDDMPSYIKIKKTLNTVDDLLRYISEFGAYGSLFSEERYKQLCQMDYEELMNYVDRGKADV